MCGIDDMALDELTTAPARESVVASTVLPSERLAWLAELTDAKLADSIRCVPQVPGR